MKINILTRSIFTISLGTVLASCALKPISNGGTEIVLDSGEILATVTRLNIGDKGAQLRKYFATTHYDIKFLDNFNVIDLGANIIDAKLANAASYPNQVVVMDMKLGTDQCPNAHRIILKEGLYATSWDFNQTQIDCTRPIRTFIDPDRVRVVQDNPGAPSTIWLVSLTGTGVVRRQQQVGIAPANPAGTSSQKSKDEPYNIRIGGEAQSQFPAQLPTIVPPKPSARQPNDKTDKRTQATPPIKDLPPLPRVPEYRPPINDDVVDIRPIKVRLSDAKK